jgi:hypothetical protein
VGNENWMMAGAWPGGVRNRAIRDRSKLRGILGLAAAFCCCVLPRVVLSAAPRNASAEDLTGRAVNPIRAKGARATVLIFFRTDCPISNRYAPEIQRLEAEFMPRGVVFWLIDPDPLQPAPAIRAYLAQYGYKDAAHVLRDPSHVLVKETGVEVTPEAAVFSGSGNMLYRGRIDDWYVRLGQYRPAPTTNDLEAALKAILAGQPVKPRTTPALGCFIADLQ